MFDEEGNGLVKTDELESLMSLIGINPTKRELVTMAKDVDKDSKMLSGLSPLILPFPWLDWAKRIPCIWDSNCTLRAILLTPYACPFLFLHTSWSLASRGRGQ